MEKCWNFIVDTLAVMFMPAVCSYIALTSNLFLNVSVCDAPFLERAANQLLTPVQYLMVGREARQNPDGTWEFVQKFDYSNLFWFKTATSIAALPASITVGTVLKAVSFCSPKTRETFASLNSTKLTPNNALYQSLGLNLSPPADFVPSQGHQRRPGDENALKSGKEAMREVTQLLGKAGIPWWVDCGTCLGAYRYGGVIPWDEDVDIAVLINDFDNVCHALKALDPKKYLVQDWSTRDHPKSCIKVYARDGGVILDIYHFAIKPETQQLQYIFALDSNCLFPEWFKIRERRFTVPVAWNTIFPLKKMLFDGIEVFVPNDIPKYLQRYYGENLAPAKVYDAATGNYEKDLSHPYWQRAYVH